MSNNVQWRIEAASGIDNANPNQKEVIKNKHKNLIDLTLNLINDNESFYSSQGKVFHNIITSVNKLVEESNNFLKSQEDHRNKIIKDIQNIKNFNDQITKDQTTNQQETLDVTNKISELKNEVKKLNADRQKLAESLDCKTLATLNIDKENELNQIFVWIIRIIYKESSAVYYWPNFKQQVFGKDQAADFKERVARSRAIDLSHEQSVLCTTLLEQKSTFLSNPLIKENHRAHVNTIFDIMDNFAKGYVKGEQIQKALKLQEELRQKGVDQEIEGDRQKQKLEALNTRLAQFQKSQRALKQLHETIEKQRNLYNNLRTENQNYLESIETQIKNKDPEVSALINIENIELDKEKSNDIELTYANSSVVNSSRTEANKQQAPLVQQDSARVTNEQTIESPQKYKAKVPIQQDIVQQPPPKKGCDPCTIF